ncbi:hypothetical protein GGR54DRAFT_636523 [Hypoxylon sp. NC1633]|nr:hypothetical protein GGR54DRAFT_636523 [Hypoxylon sp. NC1633]
MNKTPADLTDLTMAWFAQTFQTGLVPEHIWNIITWIAFLFKLASLAFAVPFLGLIVFDFCLWIWRLNRPPPGDTSQPNPITRKVQEQRASLATSPNSTSATTALNAAELAPSQRRTTYSGHTGD